MSPSLVVFLLVLSLVVSAIHGIRLDKEMSPNEHFKNHDETTTTPTKPSKDAADQVIICKDGQCTGENRKLMTISNSCSTTSLKKNIHEGTRAIPMQKGKLEAINQYYNFEHQEKAATNQRYNPIMNDGEIAEMDYTPASKKSPIHN